MDTQRIQAALRQASDTQFVRIGSDVLRDVGSLFRQAFGDSAAVVVADGTTFAVAGQRVDAYLRADGISVRKPIVLPAEPPPYADFDTVLAIEAQIRQANAIAVVVGSGTLNDVTKLASYRLGQQYFCVGTAASMDGYTAFGAAITKDGFKQTMTCPAPRAILADIEVVAKAPVQMHATGYGDLLGKVTAGADWILADALESEAIDPRSWPLVQDSLRDWLAQPAQVRAGDEQAISSLFEGLIMAGIAMQISSSSRPASGCEHRFSHLWEMQALAHRHPAIPHGFKVGIGSLAGAALYERVLERDLTAIDIDAQVARWPSRDELEREVRALHDVPLIAENAVNESLAKYITPEQLRARLLLLKERWPTLRAKLREQLLPTTQLRDMLQAVGCPVSLAEIGIDAQQLRQSYTLARTIRSRYSVLDLVHETGILDDCLVELFGPGGYWAA
jgi:glycerol-1-phosphate dehydrogenase [NAD(P)+]